MTTPLHARQRGPLGRALLLLAMLLLGSRFGQAQTVDTYNFSASAGTFTPLPATATAVTSISTDDAVTGAIPIGFNFVFDGNTYTQAYVNSNGTLSFNAGAPGSGLDAYSNGLATAVTGLRPMVAPYWDDLTGSAGTAAYQTVGTSGSRVFTFQWLNWSTLSSTTATFAFQVQLVEGTNEVRFVYRQGTTPVSSASASIGLAGTGSSSYLSLSNVSNSPTASSTASTDNLSAFPATGQIYSFTPPVPAACPQPRNLAAAASNNTALVQFTVTNANPGPFTILYGPAGFNPSLPSTGTTGPNPYQTLTTAQIQNILTGLTPGTTYQFYVIQNCPGSAGNSPRSAAGTFITQPDPAPNDNCAQAVPLTVGATCATPTNGTVFAASQSLSPLTSCSSTTAYDVWYSFVADGVTQTLAFTPQFAGIVDVRSGSCANSTSIYCTSASAGSTSTSNIVGLTSGQTYYVRVYASGATQPAPTASGFTLCVTTGPPAPANDNCAQATPLTVSATCATQVSGTVYAASQSVAPLASCPSSTAYDVWYSFVANGASQTFTFTPQFAGIMDLRTGNCANSTSIYCASTTANGTVSSNVGGLTSGTTYYVRVYASGAAQPLAAQAGFTLCVVTGPPVPANDECANAVALTVGTSCTSPVLGTVLAASQSLAPTPTCTGSTAIDVWYSFVATGPTQILTFTPQFAAIMNVRSGACANSTSLSCTSVAVNTTSATTVTGLTLNQTYFVRIYPSTVALPSPANSTFVLCASGRPLAARAQADTDALLVYPNPSNSGQLTLKLSGPTGHGQATLLNALGQVVRTQALNGAPEQTLSTRALAPGLYTLRVLVGEQVLTRKVVLE